MRFLIFSFIGILLVFPGNACAQSKILIIQSYHSDMEWVRQCNAGINKVFDSKFQLKYFYLDTKRLAQSVTRLNLKAAWSEYLRLKPDLVMLGDDNALKMLGQKFAKTKTPVVYFGINNNPRNYFKYIPKNITGVLERTPVLRAAMLFKNFLPNAKRILILMDQSPTTQSIIKILFDGERKKRIGRVLLEWKIAATWSNWKKAVETDGDYDFILMVTFHAIKLETGQYVRIGDVVNWTSEHSVVPVFSCQDYTVGKNGTVGAYTLYGKSHGELAARIAEEILAGKSPRKIPPQIDSNGFFYFNKEQLNRFNIVIPENIKENAVFR